MTYRLANKKLRIASTGKRLFAFLFDFVFAMLLVNTLDQLFREEHWDLMRQAQGWNNLIRFYGAIGTLLLVKDIFKGRSPGKFFLGMAIRRAEDPLQQPSAGMTIFRNISLIIFPVEGIFLLQDAYARRLADRWLGTVVIDKPKVFRAPLRILIANFILFGFFLAALLLQSPVLKKTAAYQTAVQAVYQYEPIWDHVESIEEIEDPEMHLDLRSQSEPSVVKFKINGKARSVMATVSLQYSKTVPPAWNVINIDIESGFSSQEKETRQLPVKSAQENF